MDALEKWCAIFLKSKYVGGDEPSIADYKVAPFMMCGTHPAVRAMFPTYVVSQRVTSFVADFMKDVKMSTVMKSTYAAMWGAAKTTSYEAAAALNLFHIEDVHSTAANIRKKPPPKK